MFVNSKRQAAADEQAWQEHQTKLLAMNPHLEQATLVMVRDSFMEERRQARSVRLDRWVAWIALLIALLALLQDFLKP